MVHIEFKDFDDFEGSKTSYRFEIEFESNNDEFDLEIKVGGSFNNRELSVKELILESILEVVESHIEKHIG